jgi:hypothetical protein
MSCAFSLTADVTGLPMGQAPETVVFQPKTKAKAKKKREEKKIV